MTVCVCASYDIGEIYKTNKYFTVLVIEFDISTFSKKCIHLKKNKIDLNTRNYFSIITSPKRSKLILNNF